MKMNVGTMMMAATLVVAGAQADSITHGGTTINMDFVEIGFSGNANDSTGFGGVSYDYRISTTEVTLQNFQASGISATDSPTWVGSLHPVSGVSYHDAARYANWLTSGDAAVGAYSFDGSGNVNGIMTRTDIVNDGGQFYLLSTQDEWYKAAYYTGSGYSAFANGTGTIPSTLDSRYLAASPWDVGTGAVEQNGTYDMMGNMWEWMEGNPVRRGGDYGSDADFDSSLNKNWPRVARDGDLGYNDMSIRIVAIPEPSSILLMGVAGGFALFIRRRFRR